MKQNISQNHLSHQKDNVAKRQLKGLATTFALKPVPPLALPFSQLPCKLHISQLHQPPIHCVENIQEFLSVYETSIFRRRRGYYNYTEFYHVACSHLCHSLSFGFGLTSAGGSGSWQTGNIRGSVSDDIRPFVYRSSTFHLLQIISCACLSLLFPKDGQIMKQ